MSKFLQSTEPGQGGADAQWLAKASRSETHKSGFRLLPVIEEETVQLGRGRPDWKTLCWLGSNVVVQRAQISPKMITHTVPQPDWVAVVFALRWNGERTWNGHEVRPWTLCLTAEPNGYETRCEKRDGFGIGLRRKQLTDTCAALSGLQPEDIKLRDLMIDMGAVMGKAFYHALPYQTADNPSLKISTGNFALEPVVENDLLCLTAQIILPYVTSYKYSLVDDSYRNALSIVRKVNEAFKGTMYTPSIADLCRAAGVGQTRLHRCFIEIYGTSPAHFIRMRRLSQCHERLLDHESPPLSVKSVALSFGFREVGRFAQYYRETFSELPSETLLRTQARANQTKIIERTL